jgi:hypothetical protein
MAEVQTKEQLLASFNGGQPEQISIQNLIETIFSLPGLADSLSEIGLVQNEGSLIVATANATDGTTGSITIKSGDSDADGTTGNVLIKTGYAAEGDAGDISILSGDTDFDGGVGGAVSIHAGYGSGAGTGGNCSVTSGDSQGAANAGSITVLGGSAFDTGNGGNIQLTGGAGKGGAKRGGNVTITRGSGSGGASAGNILMSNLPTADPGIAGALYSNGVPSAGVPKALMISGG